MKALTETETAAFQTKLGILADGRWGNQTQAAFEKWAGLSGATFVRKWPLERDMAAFYGSPGTGHATVVPPYPLYYAGRRVPKITVHEKIAVAVTAALANVLAHYGQAEISRLKLDVYDGCFSDRNKRGGTSKSTHAYAAALDFCAAGNGLREDHTTALFAKPEYRKWWELWEFEGAVSLGRARDFDWMHVQFARLA